MDNQKGEAPKGILVIQVHDLTRVEAQELTDPTLRSTARGDPSYLFLRSAAKRTSFYFALEKLMGGYEFQSLHKSEETQNKWTEKDERAFEDWLNQGDE